MTEPDHVDKIHQVGDRIVYEDERVRVWELTLEPGAESHVHQHLNDYLMICIEGDRIAAEASSGQSNPYGGAIGNFVDIPTQPGHVVFVEGGVTENAINSGKQRYRNLIVEILTPPASSTDGPEGA